MRLLLDTHVLLWAQADPARLGATRALLLAGDNDLVVSAASAWEIAIKTSIGRLHLPEPAGTWVPSRTAALGAVSLPVTEADAVGVASLPLLHRDPFDRLLVAQAKRLGLVLVSADEAVLQYDVESVRVAAH